MIKKINHARTLVIFAFTALIAAASSLFLAKPASPVQICAFLYDPCGGCTAEEGGCKPCEAVESTALAILEGAEARGIAGHVDFTVENLAAERVRSRVGELCGELDLDYHSLSLPLVVVNGRTVYQGSGAVERALDGVARPPWSASPESLPEPERQYFFSSLCADCQRAAPLVKAISATLPDGETPVAEYDIDTGEGAAAFARLRGTPEYGNVAVPALYWEGEVYTGSDEIEALLRRLQD